MGALEFANPTQSAQGAGKMASRIERIRYLNDRAPWTSAPSGQRIGSTCEYIRGMMPLLDDSLRRTVAAGQERFRRAIRMAGNGDELEIRLGLLDSLLQKIEAMGGRGASGEVAQAFDRMLAEAEALVLKKRGTAYLRLFAEKNDQECLRLADRSLQRAVERWQSLGSASMDYAKALYWLAVVSYARGKDEEALKHAEACMGLAKGVDCFAALHGNASDVRSRALVEINREKLIR